jgi:hypothetical protein
VAAALTVGGAEGTGLVAEHAGVAALVTARVDQLPLLALIERNVTAGTRSSGRLTLQQLPDRR